MPELKPIVIYRFGQLGDTIAAIPSLVALRQHFPNQQLILLSETPASTHLTPATVLNHTGLIDEFQTYPPARSWRGSLAALRSLRHLASRSDTLVYLVPSIRPKRSRTRDLLIFRLAGFRKILATRDFPSVVHPRTAAGLLEAVPHESAALLQRLAADGVSVPDPAEISVDLQLTDAERQTAATWLQSQNLSQQAWFAVCPGSKWASKLWPNENYATVGKQLVEEFGLVPVVVGGAEDQAVAAGLIAHWGRGHCAAGTLGVRESAALLEKARFYLGNDTGAMHLAAAVRTPCVAIFSAQDWPGRWEPMNPIAGHRVLRSHTPCAGCLSATCPENVLCLRQIGPAETLQACREVLTAERHHPAEPPRAPALTPATPVRSSRCLKIHLWSPSFVKFGGGIGTCAQELARALQALGHRVRLLGCTDEPSTWHGLTLQGAGRFPTFLQNPAFAGRTILAARQDRPDLILSAHLNYGPLAAFIRKSYGIPYALMAHGIDVHPGLSSARRHALLAADRILAVSHWTQGRVTRLGEISPAQLAILPNTYDEETFHPGTPDPAALTSYDFAPDEKILLMVSRLDSHEGYKGQERLIGIIPRLQQPHQRVRLVIAGSGDDLPRLQKLSLTLNDPSQVTFTGFVNSATLCALYQRADVFALPSTGEGFGIVFLEAMACGTPVLAGNTDGSSEALANGKLGLLVDPRNDTAILSGLIYLLDQQGPPLWFQRQALSTAVASRFGRVPYAQHLAEILRSIRSVSTR